MGSKTAVLSVDWLVLLLGAKIAAASSAALDPFQIQMAMFLLTQEGAIPPRDRYDFQTHEHGSYSPSLRSDLNRLVEEGFVQARHVPGHSSRRYELTATGLEIAHGARRYVTDEAARAIVSVKRRAWLASFNALPDGRAAHEEPTSAATH